MRIIVALSSEVASGPFRKVLQKNAENLYFVLEKNMYICGACANRLASYTQQPYCERLATYETEH